MVSYRIPYRFLWNLYGTMQFQQNGTFRAKSNKSATSRLCLYATVGGGWVAARLVRERRYERRYERR